MRSTALALLVLIMAPHVATGDEAGSFWQAARSPGHIVLMRHALAPGTGDPPNFDIDDCATQRNLSEAGRTQARAIGRAFRHNGIEDARVYTSAWCRARDTARLLDIGEVEVLSPLNSFFGRPGRRPGQMAALRRTIRDLPLEEPVVMVTHQVVISALTGVFARSGEMVLVRRGENGLQVVARLQPENNL